ncbi:uncharacterized protein [Drosophila tropicalis]
MTRCGKQLAIYKRLCYQSKSRGRRSSVAGKEINSIRNLNFQSKTTLYLNDKQTAAITSWISPGFYHPGEDPKISSAYTNQQRSNIAGIAGFFSKQGEAWETVKNKEIPVIMNVSKEAWENIKSKANPQIMNVRKEAWNTMKNKDFSVIKNATNKAWKTIKNNANPVTMNVPNVMPNLNQLKLIAKELMDKLESLRDPKTRQLKPEYKDFIMFVSFITSLGLLRDRPNPKASLITQYFMDSLNKAKTKNDVSSVNSVGNCLNEDINSISNDDLNEDVNTWSEDLKQSPEFQRFYQNYKDSIGMANTYIEEAVQSFELVDNDNNKWVLDQLNKFKNQVAGIMAIGMILVGNNTNLEVPQADTSGAFDQIGENKSITEMSSVKAQAHIHAENIKVGENVPILDQIWGLSKYGPTVIAVSMLILGADTTSFGFVSVLYRLICYFSK